jgi:putative ATPase
VQHLHRFLESTFGLELAVKSTPKNEQGEIKITLPIIEECVQRKALTHDKDGDAHY